jgi:hypothetical protein
MSDWIHGLPVLWMGIVIFVGIYLGTAVIYAVVMRLAVGERARTFKGVSPGLLPPLGIIFGLLVAFVAAQVWSDIDRANVAVNREASALREIVLLSNAFPGEPASRLKGLVARQIRDAKDVEWPAMAKNQATLHMVPGALAEALTVALTMPVKGDGQVAAQRAMLAALENALDARRMRILVSHAEVNPLKWLALLVEAAISLAAIAVVHSDNRATSRLALGLFSTAVAMCILMIAAHDRPFTGQVSISPTALVNVQPEAPVADTAH